MFAQRISRLTSSLVRDILAKATQPGMISFAGGLPADESLFVPQVFIDGHSNAIPQHIWQYGTSEGEPALREQVACYLQQIGLSCTADQVLIVNGSQQGIDLVAKLLIEDGTPVLCESPTYLSALQVFQLFGAAMQPLQQDAQGIAPAALSAAASTRLIYMAPTFQNPTGRCYPAERRQVLARIFDQRDEIVFEDDPYRELSFDQPAPAPLVSHLRKTKWIYQGSFSKSLAPGLRLGYLVAHPDLMPMLVRLKQASDLHSNRLSQYLVCEALAAGALARHVEQVLPIYRERRDAMDTALRQQLGTRAHWQLPAGGLFFWLQLNQHYDTMKLMELGLKRGLALMPGDAFYPGPAPESALRLNFSHSTTEQIQKGVAILAQLLTEQQG